MQNLVASIGRVQKDRQYMGEKYKHAMLRVPEEAGEAQEGKGREGK